MSRPIVWWLNEQINKQTIAHNEFYIILNEIPKVIILSTYTQAYLPMDEKLVVVLCCCEWRQYWWLERRRVERKTQAAHTGAKDIEKKCNKIKQKLVNEDMLELFIIISKLLWSLIWPFSANYLWIQYTGLELWQTKRDFEAVFIPIR